ncbi:tolloid-like protein 1 [Sitophilus oryzae]|uniref:Tolloid-like protein 1 n=1 Tax=Sitophilus oryzae TaxID=7048 RepID=A0A6J2Y414_SITOR|nr:tolloid-like protein 1 [Sitophilus oryzae]
MDWDVTAIRPIIKYDAVAWWQKANQTTAKNKLSKLQRQACLAVTGAFHSMPSKDMETLLDLPPLQIILEREARWATYRFPNMARESQGTIMFIQNRLEDELQSDEILGMVSDLTPAIQLLTRIYNVLFSNRDEWDKPRNGLLLAKMCCDSPVAGNTQRTLGDVRLCYWWGNSWSGARESLWHYSSLAVVARGIVPRPDLKKDHCNKTVDVYEDVTSPEVTDDNFGKQMTCWYRFRSFRGTPKDWILRIKFNKFKVGTLLNGSHCEGGFMQIVDGNAKTDVSNRKEPGMFCGETEQPQTFMSETSFVKVLFHVENFTDQTYFSFDTRAEQQLVVYLRYGQHPELYPNRRGEIVQGSYCERIFRDCRLQTCYVQSPAYPGVYPRNLHCRYYLNTRLPFIKLYIENEEFNIDGQRCENIMTCPMRPISSGQENCPYDYIKIYDGKNEFSPVIGIFCGMGKFPYSIIGTSQDLFVEFVSSPAGPLLNTGFHFNVGNWPGHVDTAGSKNGTCDWLLSSESLRASGDTEGIFLSVAHWYPPHTICTYLMQGEEGEIVRLYFPSFRINRIESPIQPTDGDCGESLTLYDASWPDDSRIIKTFCDTFSKAMEKHDFVSTGNSLYVRFESKTGSYSG